MEVKSKELIGRALNWAVAKVVKGKDPEFFNESVWISTRGLDQELRRKVFEPSTDWVQGGLIIELEGISWHCGNKSNWHAYAYGSHENVAGPTPLVAAMRCYVVSKLGDTVEIPDELL